MASRRKASTPCMIRPEQTVEQDDPEDMEVSIDRPEEEAPVDMDQPKEEHPSGAVDPEQHGVTDQEPPAAPESPKPQKRQQGGYECKYCTFSTQKLTMFKEHVDAQHPNVILNPLYLCAVCNFNTKKFDTLTEHNDRCHPGESNFKFKRVKLNNQTILEQTIEGCSSAVIYNSTLSAGAKAPNLAHAAKGPVTDTPPLPPQLTARLTSDLSRKHITAVNVNGTVVFPEATVAATLLKDGLSHIMPSLQRPPNYSLVPKVAVPLNTAKYNSSLDGNLTLIASFNKFPYPTQAELSWLTAASKHPEDQIKVWFTTQRLKQGISWSPEEVEEARKKMFNGTIQPGHQTITVVPAQLTTTSSTRTPQTSTLPCPSPRPFLQPLSCHRMGHTSLVLTPVVNGSSITCAPITLTLANQVAQSIKRPLATPSVVATEIKRPSIIQTIQATTSALPKPIIFAADSSKTPDQLASLRVSYSGCAFPEEEEVYRLIETTGLSRGEIKKWFTHQRLLNLKTSTSTPPPPPPLTLPLTMPPLPVKKEDAVPATSDCPARQTVVPVQFPLLERVKGKTSEQLKTLEESFQRSGGPGEAELDRLVLDTRLSKTEIACWFSERRALRDNMEKALQNSLASKKNPERSPTHGAGAAGGGGGGAGGGVGLVLNGGGTSSREELDTSSVKALRSSPLPPVLSAATSPEPLDGRCLALLREVFCRTQWPSPEEYIQLEVQTGLVRTNIVRWFKEHRSALKTHGTLEWMEEARKQGGSPGAQNGQSSSSSSLSSSSSSSSSSTSTAKEKVQDASPGVQVKTLKVSREEDSDKLAESEKSKLSNQDIVQWFTNKLGQSMSDLSRTRPDQSSSPSTDRGRWVKVTMAVGDEGKAGLERPRLGADADVLPLEHSGRVTG